MKDAVATMGGLLPDDVGGRDAVHVAVFSARSGHRLLPGQTVGLKAMFNERDADVVPDVGGIGIVDPFLGGAVPPGERFWVYLYPRTITGLSHAWTHPAFEETGTSYATPANKISSEEWLRTWCEGSGGPGYEAVMAKAAKVADGIGDSFDDDYMHFDGQDAHGEIPDEFWDHAEVVLGRPIQGQRAKYFSCSC